MHLPDLIDVIVTILRRLVATHPRAFIEACGTIAACALVVAGWMGARLSG